MDMSWLTTPRSEVPQTLCREMPAACRANLDKAERDGREADADYLEASDRLRKWVELDGRVQKSILEQEKLKLQGQVYRHSSDKRHWLLRGQAWRKCLQVHPDLAAEPAGSKCSHGYVTPMCVVDQPAIKVVERSRIPGEDDE